MKNFLRVLSMYCSMTILAAALFSCEEEPKEPEKTLNSYLVGKIEPFDPARISDVYTKTVFGQIAEALYAYKYTTDDYELEPQIALSMPEVSADGLTYTIQLRQDAHFYDPLGEVFPDGKGRPVNAHDFVLSMKRLADPANKADSWWLFDGRIQGLNEWAEAGADYASPVEGFKALDDYTIQLVLSAPYPQILYALAMSASMPVAQEALDFYGAEDFANYPIGTGAYYYDRAESIPGSQHVLRANPHYRSKTFPAASEAGSKARQRLGMKVLEEYEGRQLPFCDKVVYHVIPESSVQWLKFLNGELDVSGIPKDNFATAVIGGELSPEMKEQGIWLDINPLLDVTYTFLNMELPIFRDNPKLRQAMSLALNHEKIEEIFYNNRSIAAQTIVPPGVGGYDADYRNPYATYDPQRAAELLAEAGFPDGEGLPVLKYQMYNNSSTNKQMVEFFIENMAAIGIQVEAVPGDWPTFLEAIDSHNIEIGGMGWNADYPDAQNFIQMHYSENAAPGPNNSNYANPEFDALYEETASMQQGPARDALYARAAQLAAEDVSLIMGVHRLSYALVHPWVKTRCHRQIGVGYAKFVDIDSAQRSQKTGS